MPNVTAHAPGTFCWIELATSDALAAKAFYSELFGWTANEIPMGEGGAIYTIFQKDGADCAAMFQITESMVGLRPNWLSYVAVDDLDAVTEQAKTLGGNLVNGPFEVFDSGRMSVLTDPHGARFALWKARSHIGVSIRDEPGTLCWNELQTRNVGVAKSFYAPLFGWNVKENAEYVEVFTGDQVVGGVIESKAPPQAPSHWMPYLAVDDCEGTAQQAELAGATIRVAPMEIPKVGKFSVLIDPQGATLAIIQLNF